jgi:hypothetical protein
MDRRQQHRRVKDLLQHLDRSCEQWAEANGAAAQYLAQTIDRQLAELRGLLLTEQAVMPERRAA